MSGFKVPPMSAVGSTSLSTQLQFRLFGAETAVKTFWMVVPISTRPTGRLTANSWQWGPSNLSSTPISYNDWASGRTKNTRSIEIN